MTYLQRETYCDCITKQLEESDLLFSIYTKPEELKIRDPGVISVFNDFLETPDVDPTLTLKGNLEYTITLVKDEGNSAQKKLTANIELPHLYPLLEHAIVSVETTRLTKSRESVLKTNIVDFIETLPKEDPYVFQIINWLEEHIDDWLEEPGETTRTVPAEDALSNFERLWIYSHHLKSKTKRQEIVRQSRNLDLSGFSRPGKPGVICVEGLKENTQEFWRVIKAMHWQKISICKSEEVKKALSKLPHFRRFEGFKEQLFCDDLQHEEGVMNMGLFIKYLESHNSGYMKKELFGLD